MPGIAGIISSRPADQCQAWVQTMVATMAHEPFYRTGAYFAPPMGVYAGWTALPDSFAEHQVFFNEDKTVALLFAGECYPAADTAAALKQKGHVFGTGPGTWLVHLYEEWGADFFEKLNGLFSGLLIDRRANLAWLFNDRYGFQRIYYHAVGADFYFASEAKALLRILPGLRAFDAEGVAEFLACGCTLGERSLFKGIQRLPGASRWRFDHGRCHRAQYFSPETWTSLPPLPAGEFAARLQAVFPRLLPPLFENAAKIGIALTGGLDSRLIMACRPSGGVPQTCYTYSGPRMETLDDVRAAQVASACGLKHQLLRLGPDFFAGFAAHADRTVFLTDGCFGITGAHEIYFSRLARQLAPVRLTGVFGGEILRGVSTFKLARLAPGLLTPEMTPLLDAASNRFGQLNRHPVGFAAFQEVPLNIFGSLSATQSQVHFRTPYLDNELVALACQTPRAFQHSGAPVFAFVRNHHPRLGAIPTDMGYVGDLAGWRARAAGISARITFKLDYLSNDGLPHWLSPLDPVLDGLHTRGGLLGRHKFLRYRRWFRRELAPWVQEAMAGTVAAPSPFWNLAFLRQLAARHVSGRNNFQRELNAVLTLQAVERLLFHPPPATG